MPNFSHLHVHTQFSLLDGAAEISKLMKKAKADEMKAIAITDHGNMFGAFRFVAEANKQGIKPIVGCEFYMVEDRHVKQFTKEKKDKRYHQLFLAKNELGYKNLSKLCSFGYKEGLYSKWPRIDKELVLKYHEGLIATTCCLGAEVPQAILNLGEEKAEKIFLWWLDIFGEDYYVELQRHNLPDQDKVNPVLLKFAKKHNVKIIASNDSHYIDQEDANAHDLLLCINTADIQETPKATDEESGKGYRFGFPNDEFYFKTQAEMSALFADLPDAIANTEEVADKVELLNLQKQLLLPEFPIPKNFINEDEYLKHLTLEGARKRYSEMNTELEERINFELHTIKTMGFPGYFLIVSDFIKAGRDLNVYVGPGRGSAAGSVVAYCIGITNIDPMKYGLLFERFLNPDRKSMPDIDTDFDDEGRQKILDYVIKKYGYNQVAQVVTYGTMATKSSIKDVARALNLPLNDATALTKLVPDKPGSPSLIELITDDEKKIKAALNGDDYTNVLLLRDIANGDDLAGETIREAMKLEGSVRSTGIHACAVIIAPNDLTEHLPLSTSKNSNLWVTQYDGNVIEDAGFLKMDFLGLKTLTIIKKTINLIKERHKIEFDIEGIPLDDERTFELFKKGETISVFQYESEGMQKVLKDLQPDKFEDLIAVNALYRPGPMDYIPLFIDRKHGRKEIAYDFEALEGIMAETYGVTVYQEQVMMASQILANFSKGDADGLRKAMGKKIIAELDKLSEKFFAGCRENGLELKTAEKIWKDWQAFASYAFNKSHATCYALLGFQTAYLKAHYPAEYMAAVLNNAGNIDSIAFFMEECKRMGIKVLGPDLNESNADFAVNNQGEIRFGLGSIKGAGEKAIENIIAERQGSGKYKDIFDLTCRGNLKSINKRVLEALAKGGAFDFDQSNHRAQYFNIAPGETSAGIDMALKFGASHQANESNQQASLFGDGKGASLKPPKLPELPHLEVTEELRIEKEVVGMFISGHPLDQYGLECKFFTTHTSAQLSDLTTLIGKELKIAGIVTHSESRMSQAGSAWGKYTIEDFDGAFSFNLYKDDFARLNGYLAKNNSVLIDISFVNVNRNEEEAPNIFTKVKKVSLMESILKKNLKGLSYKIDLKAMTISNIDEIMNILEKNKGETVFVFQVYESGEAGEVNLGNEGLLVKPSIQLIKSLEEIAGKVNLILN